MEATQTLQMSVEKANAFIDAIKKDGPSPQLIDEARKSFTKDHLHEAMKARGVDLKQAAGGDTPGWLSVGVGVAALF